MADSIRIFVVEDDEDMRRLINRSLIDGVAGVSVAVFSSANGVIEAALAYKPHLIILDWVLGHGKTGLTLCRELKQNLFLKKASVLIISGKRASRQERLETMAWGADGFLKKPFSMIDFLMHAKALIRKSTLSSARPAALLRVGTIVLNRRERQVCGPGGNTKRLPPKLFSILWLLAKHYPRPVAGSHLIRHVWKNSVRDAEVWVAVFRLKKYLEPDYCSIKSVTGQGYLLTFPCR
ncbi:MAG: response regulator transcription factor [Elusimicrobia bacterium]|nr:response regulator transcription factor [Elusimicrobiota bacterium]